jgi:hypothetical protein
MLDNFTVEELVPESTFNAHGSKAFKMIDNKFLHDVDRFITDLKRDKNCGSVYINTWLWGGHFFNSGLRELKSGVGRKRSEHKKANAYDLKFKDGFLQIAYEYLIENQEKYPNIRRVENISVTPTWLHLDGKEHNNGDKIHTFYP